MIGYNEKMHLILDLIESKLQKILKNSNDVNSNQISKILGVYCSEGKEFENNSINITGGLQFEGIIADFFELLISDLGQSFVTDGRLVDFLPIAPPKNKKRKFYQHLIDDVRMLLLKDAVITLNAIPLNYVKFKTIKNEFYLDDYSEFEELIKKTATSLSSNKIILNEFITKQNGKDKSDNKTLREILKKAQYRMPRILFPWLTFALINSKHTISIDSTAQVKLVIEKNLCINISSLKKSPDNKVKVISKILEIQNHFASFIKTLETPKDPNNVNFVNSSLSLFVYNEITNHLDLDILLHKYIASAAKIDDKSNLEDFLNKKIDNGNKIKFKKKPKTKFKLKRDRLKQVSYFLDDKLSSLGILNTIGLKNFLLSSLDNNQIYSNNRIWNILNDVITVISTYVEMIISEKNTNEDSPYSIYYQIYKDMKNFEPYTELISSLSKSTEKFYPTTPSENDDLYYAYHLLCQHIQRYKFDDHYQYKSY